MKHLSRVSRTMARLNGVDWAQLHVKVAGAAWAVALFLFTPRVLGDALGSQLTFLLCALLIVGACVSSVGLVLAARDTGADLQKLRDDLPRAVFGLLVEFVGLALMAIAVALYFASQAALTAGPEGDQRIALACLAYWVLAMVVSRIASVLHRRRKEIKTANTRGVNL